MNKTIMKDIQQIDGKTGEVTMVSFDELPAEVQTVVEQEAMKQYDAMKLAGLRAALNLPACWCSEGFGCPEIALAMAMLSPAEQRAMIEGVDAQ